MNKRTQNNLNVYFSNQNSGTDSRVIYESYTDYSLSNVNLPFFHQVDCTKIDKLFTDGSNIAVLSAESGMGKTHTLREYAKNFQSQFKNVIFTSFDKNHYIFTNNKQTLSDDCIIRKCITRIFYDEEFYTKKFSHNYFVKDSAEDLLYSLANQNTLIIIDDFDLSYIPEYLYSLCNKGFKILLASRSAYNAPHDERYSVANITLGDISSDDIKNHFGVDRHFTDVFGCNPLAARFAQGYGKLHGGFTDCEIDKLKVIAKEKSLDLKKDFVAAFWHLAHFSENSKELLRSVCLLLFYTPQILYSCEENSTFFSLNDACHYTSRKKQSFYNLISLGFIGKTSEGMLYMDNAVSEFIFRYQTPNANNCRCLSDYLTNSMDFILSQFFKDQLAQARTDENEKKLSKATTTPILDVIAYFISHGDFKNHILYNCLSVYMIKNLSTNMSHHYTYHLTLRNTRVLIEGLNEILSDNRFGYIYECQKSGPEMPYIFTSDILAKLDIIRICISLLRFSHGEQYEEYNYIFRLLSDAFSYIINYCKIHTDNIIHIYCTVIEICLETFVFFNDISPDGFYIPSRCNERSCVSYTDNQDWNCENACSLYVLHSPQVFRLYCSFHDIIRLFVKEYEKCDTKTRISIQKPLLSQSNKFSKEFSAFFHRVKNGFDVFYGFYDKKYMTTDTHKEVSDMDDKELEFLLEKARYFRNNGFDGSTETSAEKYALEIYDVVKNCSSPLFSVLIATDSNFPISDSCINSLMKLNFSELICEKCTRSMLCDVYEHCTNHIASRPERLSFYEDIIRKIHTGTKLYDTSVTIGAANISLFFVSQVCAKLCDYLKTDYSKLSSNSIFPLLDVDNILSLYETIIGDATDFVCSEHCICHGIIRLIRGKKLTKKLTSDLHDALLSFIYERLPWNFNISWTGFTFLVCHLLPQNLAMETINEMLYSDFASKISPETIRKIKDFLVRRNL